MGIVHGRSCLTLQTLFPQRVDSREAAVVSKCDLSVDIEAVVEAIERASGVPRVIAAVLLYRSVAYRVRRLSGAAKTPSI